MQVSFSKMFPSLSAFIAKVLTYMLELRIDLKHVAEAEPGWDLQFHMEKKEVENLGLRVEDRW